MKGPGRAPFPNPDWQLREVGGRELKRPRGQVSADWPLGRLAPRGPLTPPSFGRAARKAAGSKGRGRGAEGPRGRGAGRGGLATATAGQLTLIARAKGEAD